MDPITKYRPLLETIRSNRFTVIDTMEGGVKNSHPYDPGIWTVLIGNSGEVLAPYLTQFDRVSASTVKIFLQKVDGSIFETLPHMIDYMDIVGIVLPAVPQVTSMQEFVGIIAQLRHPEDGCPWDKVQTYATLRKYLLEESYEALDAIDLEDPKKMEEEFGDLLLLITLYAQIGLEKGHFNIHSILFNIAQKMIRRHPHIFGSAEVDGVHDVLTNWQKIKEQERKNSGDDEKGILDGLPRSMPALSQGLELQARAAKVGFDWPDINGVLDKINEEIREIEDAKSGEELEGEFGDLLFVLVNYARWRQVDPEVALHRTNAKFRARFKYIEQQLHRKGLKFDDVGLVEMDALWNQAKQNDH